MPRQHDGRCVTFGGVWKTTLNQMDTAESCDSLRKLLSISEELESIYGALMLVHIE